MGYKRAQSSGRGIPLSGPIQSMLGITSGLPVIRELARISLLWRSLVEYTQPTREGTKLGAYEVSRRASTQPI